MNKPTVNTIDAILPQTQCGLCSYGACQPYAKALVEEDAAINLCPPGGIATLKKLGELLHRDPTPFIDDMRLKTKLPTRAVIREDECIGCTKCIQVCPVDAIIGSSKQMHTIITDECTGCDLCLDPCPMDCIDMLPIVIEDAATIKLQANRARQRYHARQERLAQQENTNPENEKEFNSQLSTQTPTLDARKTAILEAVARAAAKRQSQPLAESSQ
jgi:Na+-translocating ferredoxin:NAD+ oxidoreductase subunit B